MAEVISMVYVMRRSGQRYKIGCTRNIFLRYRVKSDRDKIVVKIPTDEPMVLEEAIHKLFFGKRLGQAEVFILSKSDLGKLRGLSKAENPLEMATAMRTIKETRE
jgi:hypothetical protein